MEPRKGAGKWKNTQENVRKWREGERKDSIILYTTKTILELSGSNSTQKLAHGRKFAELLIKVF